MIPGKETTAMATAIEEATMMVCMAVLYQLPLRTASESPVSPARVALRPGKGFVTAIVGSLCFFWAIGCSRDCPQVSRKPPRRTGSQQAGCFAFTTERAPPNRRRAPSLWGRPPYDLRQVLNGILYLNKAGCQWRMRHFGPYWAARESPTETARGGGTPGGQATCGGKQATV